MTNVKGLVTRTAATVSAPVALLTELATGTDVALQPGAMLNLVYLKSGVEFQLTGPSRVVIDATEPTLVSGNRPVSRSSVVAAQTVKLQTENGRVVLGGVVMRGVGAQQLKLLEPTGKVLEARPQFGWLAPVGATAMRLVLREEGSDRVLASTAVSGERWTPDASVVLQPGVNYLWSIEATLPDAGRLVRSSYFSLVSEPERQRVVALRPEPDAVFSDRLIYASLLEQARYVSESRKWWQQLSRERPDLVELRGLANQ
ncbi:MAG: hypothetical protein IPF55_09345 [Rhodoferax sp.]|nr:hypothetical protein [Rhodoferax sp.]